MIIYDQCNAAYMISAVLHNSMLKKNIASIIQSKWHKTTDVYIYIDLKKGALIFNITLIVIKKIKKKHVHQHFTCFFYGQPLLCCFFYSQF